MHRFYYAITANPQRPEEQFKRVERIQSAVRLHGLICHTETHGYTITLQVETDDDQTATIFKLAAESALYEDHL